MECYPIHVKKEYRGCREVAPLILSSALDGGEWWKEAFSMWIKIASTHLDGKEQSIPIRLHIFSR